MLAREQHVGGLDVAVHEPGGVRGVQPGGDLGDDLRRAARGQAAVALERAVQVGPRDVAHDEVQPPALLAGRVHGHEVRVVDRGGQARLEREAGAQPGSRARSAAITLIATGRPRSSWVAR